MSGTWGPDAFRGVAGRSRTRAGTRRVLGAIGLAVLSAGLVLLVVFASLGRGADVAMLAVGASVATLASYASVRVVQGALAWRPKPGLEALRRRQLTRMGPVAIPTPLERIVQELEFARTSLRYYHRVLAPRLRRLAKQPLATTLDRRIASAGEPGSGLLDRLPERLTRRGVDAGKLEELIRDIEAVRGDRGAGTAHADNRKG